jgi:hypothetical protein
MLKNPVRDRLSRPLAALHQTVRRTVDCLAEVVLGSTLPPMLLARADEVIE